MTGRIIIQEPMAVRGWRITPIKIHIDQFEDDCPPEWADYESFDVLWHPPTWKKVLLYICLLCRMKDPVSEFIDSTNERIGGYVEDYKDDPVVFVEMIYHLGNPKTNLR